MNTSIHIEYYEETTKVGVVKLVFHGGPEVVLDHLWVHPDHRNKGIASKLLADAILACRNRPVERMTMNAIPFDLDDKGSVVRSDDPERVTALKAWYSKREFIEIPEAEFLERQELYHLGQWYRLL